MNSKATKAALVTSIASLILCFTMLMGTTLAWFVDRVENTNNRIEAGNLEIDLVMYKEAAGDYISIANGSGDLFTEAKGSPVQWSPGKTETIYLGVRNKGTLALSYEATIDVVEGTLLGVLDYTIIDLGTTPPALGGAMSIANSENSRRGNIVDLSQNLLLGRGTLLKILDDPTAEENQNETHYYAFSVHMKDDADPVFQGKTISLDITVSAKQLTKEERTEYEGSTHMLSGILDEEKVTTLSGTLWKFKDTIADYEFLNEEADGEENADIIFPEETVISDDKNEYPLSTLRVIPLDGAKLLVAVPLEETEEEEIAEVKAEEEAPPEKVFVYYPKPEETTEESDEAILCGWYLIAYEDFQKLISDEANDINGLFVSENNITDAEKLPVIAFPEDESDVIKDEDLINWLYQSAELTETSIPLS